MKSKYLLKNNHPETNEYLTETIEIGCIYDDFILRRKFFVTNIVVDELGLKWVKCYDIQNPDNPDSVGFWPLKECFKAWRKIQ